MQANLQRIDELPFAFEDEVRSLPANWEMPDNWNPNWKLRIRVNFNENEEVTERLFSVHDEDGEIIMYAMHSRSNPRDLYEDCPEAVGAEVFSSQIALAEKLRGQRLAIHFWVLSEIILIETDELRQRLILDLSGNGWTKKNVPEYIDRLKRAFKDSIKIFEYDEDGVYFVILDFNK